jgi:TetR/AcrR family transcriptional regulator, tetracycline repressor protein
MDSDHLPSPESRGSPASPESPGSPGRRRGAPPAGQRLTRDAVVSRATEAIARDGLAPFSLRGLAEALGVAPNAIYNHVASREDLLDAVTERFLASVRLPPGQQPWAEWVRTVATALRAQLLERPGLTELVLSRAGATATGPELLGGFLDRLQSAGLDRATAHLAWHAVLTVVVGSLRPDRAHRGDQGATFEAVLDVTLTGLAAVARQPASSRAVALLEAHQLSERPT